MNYTKLSFLFSFPWYFMIRELYIMPHFHMARMNPDRNGSEREFILNYIMLHACSSSTNIIIGIHKSNVR
jgi:hypothetical protein